MPSHDPGSHTPLPTTVAWRMRQRIAAVNLFALLAACGPIVKPATFRQRPDSVKLGSAIGPFEGRVVDVDTNKPIEGALVSCSWSFDRGLGSPAPHAVRRFHVHTDPDGNYRVPKLKSFPQGLSTRLARFSLLVYRKDYVAYRHDSVFDARRRRIDFFQYGNTIALSRWSPELSHARHLLFVGGDEALRKETASELRAAASELDRGKPLASAPRWTPAQLQADAPSGQSQLAKLLTSDGIREVTGYAGAFQQRPLANPGDAVDTLHFRAVDRPERYDVAVRIWRLQGVALTDRYDKLLDSLAGSQQTDEVADRSFVVTQGEIMAIGLMESASAALVLVTCGKGQCSKKAHLTALAEKIISRFPDLPRPPASAEPTPSEDDEDADEPDQPGLEP